MILTVIFLLLITICHAQPSTFVIEFDRPLHSFASKRHVHHKRSVFYHQLTAYNISYQIRHEYDMINAVSIEFETPPDSQLFFEKALGIKKAWPVNTVTKPKVFETKSADIKNVQSLFGLYNATGVSRVRDELGITGNGVKVGIIDTGVDYTHPALGGCFGSGCRVAFGYDFVGDLYTGDNAPVPGSDPRDTCNGHGTHVTGIIGARDAQFTGIAPDVTFGAYRIFGCSGSSSDDVIMKAMERAYLDGMDIINLSLGDVGWPESPASLLADELSMRGMIVCAAAGNEGEKGVFEVGAPSLGKHALSIASVDNKHVLAHTFKVADVVIGYTTASGAIFNISAADIVPTSSDFLVDRDACDSTDADLKGKVALIHRGGCTFSQKILVAEQAGAIAVIIYNNNPGPVTPSIDTGLVKIDYGGISKQDGYNLFMLLRKRKALKAEFMKEDVNFPVPTAGSISAFSSWGLGPDLSLKPDISAPGGQIYSTYPMALGGYATLSGTSMASPYVAGVVALIQASRGGSRSISANELRAMLINNGHPFNIFGSESLESVARQGSGLIDVYQAVKSDTIVTPEQIRLNDVAHGSANNEYIITIKNRGRLACEYLISHVAASTAQAFKENSVVKNMAPLREPVILSNHEVEANVELLTTFIVVEANQEANITVKIAPPANSAVIPPSIYSGYIVVTKNYTREDVIYVPYAGLTSNLNKLPVLIMNDTMPSLQTTHVSLFSPALLSLQLAEASPLLTITVINAADPSQDLGYIPGGYTTFVGRNSIDDLEDTSVASWYGNIASTPEQASLVTFRHSIKETFGKTIATDKSFAQIGSRLQKGTYKLKVKALRPFGNKDNEEDYDVWISPEITLD